MSLDLTRFCFEQQQLQKLFGEQIPLVRFADSDAWPSFGVQFRCGTFLVQGHFAPDHPVSPPRFQVHPAPASRHYYEDGRGPHLCYLHPNEWRPTYSMATVVGIVRVFLTKYQLGKPECV